MDRKAYKRSLWRKSMQNITWCTNYRFEPGQTYKLRKEHREIVATVEAVSPRFVRFVGPGGFMASGEIMKITNPTCQSCNIDGFDIVFAYDVL